jgi:hypothetical protein
MKNTFTSAFALVVLGFAVLGCSSINPLADSKEPSNSAAPSTNRPTAESNKTTTDKVVDSTVGRSKIGVPECDEVMDLIEAEANNPDDNFVTKAVKATVLNRIKDGIRDSVEKNKQDTTEMAKTCKEFRTQFDKYKAEEMNKK